MTISKLFRNLINKNVYIKDLILYSTNFRLNNEIKKNMDIFSEIDSIYDIENLQENIAKYIKIKKSGVYAIRRYGAESLHYGHIQTLYRYSNLELRNFAEMPLMEHGITYDGKHTVNMFNKGILAISQGDYMLKKLRKVNKRIPLFPIGPYIHYADQYYSQSKIEDLKKKNGRTMLVFPYHTYENSLNTTERPSEFVEKIVEIYNKSYDTLYVCSYWLDLESDIIKSFRDRGAKIVSAGARFDSNFLSRLKTIMTLSDVVYSDDIGTNIGYSMYLKKPFFILNSSESIESWRTKEFNEKRTEIIRAFSDTSSRNVNVQKELYSLFWGGDESLKTPKEIKEILEFNKSLIRKKVGFNFF